MEFKWPNCPGGGVGRVGSSDRCLRVTLVIRGRTGATLILPPAIDLQTRLASSGSKLPERGSAIKTDFHSNSKFCPCEPMLGGVGREQARILSPHLKKIQFATLIPPIPQHNTHKAVGEKRTSSGNLCPLNLMSVVATSPMPPMSSATPARSHH